MNSVEKIQKTEIEKERIYKYMLRYENVATEVIKVDLQNDFRVFGMALWDKENTCYKVTLYLQYANIDTLHMDLDHENIIFDESERKTIKYDMCKYINKLFENNEFTRTMNNIKYEISVFDKKVDA
jgi:hypothetical protein